MSPEQSDGPWGEPVESHITGSVRVDTRHEGVVVVIRRPDRTAEVVLGPAAARRFGRYLDKAIRQWEE